MKIDLGRKYNHGNALKNKAASTADVVLQGLYESYIAYRESLEQELNESDVNITEMIKILNDYRRHAIPILEARRTSGQEGLRSTILEEFMFVLFSRGLKDYFSAVPDNLFVGKAKSYVDLTFTPHSFGDIFQKPVPYIHTKDQDFVIGATFDLTIHSGKSESVQPIIVPAVAIECKTYIEKNMLDSCAGTARRLKSAMPYCLYFVVSEYMKMESATPELTDIDEVYVLCKATVGERTRGGPAIHDIDEKLVGDLYKHVFSHLRLTWWDPLNALTLGKIINRPQ